MEKEHRFWLQILMDHSTFIYEALAPSEDELIAKALDINRRLAEFWRSGNFKDFTVEILDVALDLRDFKRSLIEKHTNGDIVISLPPTFINHMLNEIDEYIFIMHEYLEKGTLSRPSQIQLHILWLSDAEGHAGSLMCKLDPTEKITKKKLKKLKKKFNGLFMKAHEFSGYLRATKDFNAIGRLDKEATDEINIFINLLNEIRELRLSKELLGTIQPLLVEHMIREEKYYLEKMVA